jgi:hypothetical protein
MSGVERRLVGSIGLADFAALCDLQGYERLPYPFAHTAPVPQGGPSGAGTQEIAERFSNGDLRVFAPWIEAFPRADIWVECRVHHRSGLADTRLLAHRADESGFVATQRTTEDVVDVYAVSAYDLGPAIAGSVGLTKPGRRPEIVIPRCVNYFAVAGVDSADDCVAVRVPVAGPTRVRVRDSQVAALATVQSRHQPARSWGVDWAETFLVWVRVDDDGDYIYDAAFRHAEPMSERRLSERIEGLIAADVAALRRRRGLG